MLEQATHIRDYPFIVQIYISSEGQECCFVTLIALISFSLLHN